MSIEFVALLMASGGAMVQFSLRLHELRLTSRAEIEHFDAVRGLMEEVSWIRPGHRLKRRSEVMDALRERPGELGNYRRVYWELVGWTLICGGATLAVIAMFE